MLLVAFRSGGSLFAVDARRVVEVVPKVAPRPIPHAPAELLGLLSYRGKVVPVIDFGVLIGSTRARDVLSTRIILARLEGRGGGGRLVGILAEDVSRVYDADPSRIVSDPIRVETAPYLGALVKLDEGLVQLVEADKLLTGRFDAALLDEATETR